MYCLELQINEFLSNLGKIINFLAFHCYSASDSGIKNAFQKQIHFKTLLKILMTTSATIFEFKNYLFEPKKKKITFIYRIIFGTTTSKNIEFQEIIKLPATIDLKQIPA